LANASTAHGKTLPLLLSLSGASAALSIWQWLELEKVNAGGIAGCRVNEVIDCAPAWQSDFAQRVHALTGLPLAGLGLVWSLTALSLCVGWWMQRGKEDDATPWFLAIKSWATLGILACLGLSVVSFRLQVLCPTCLATYLLTGAFFAVVFLKPLSTGSPGFAAALRHLPRALAIALPLHLAMAFASHQLHRKPSPTLTSPGYQGIRDYLKSLEPMAARAIRDARDEWKAEHAPAQQRPPPRERWGAADAPVQLVEFTDVLCSHCRSLLGALNEIKRSVPAGRFSIEPRYFPLDAECNPNAGKVWGDGIRCLGAKVQLCLEGRPEFWEVREKIFENQSSLSQDNLMKWATEKGLSRPQLESCLTSEATAQKLKDDIAWALAYQIQGTPMVLVNEKKAAPVPPFLLALIMAFGDPNSDIFNSLPSPQ
jgi:serine/threonine-protein kinase